MNFIERNFISLLASGAFGVDSNVEPLSYWKWRRLYQMSLMHGVSALVFDGIERHQDDAFANVPQDLLDMWRKKTEEVERDNDRVNVATAELIRSLHKEKLRPILLKGQAVAELYPNPKHRTGGDCDLFFPYEDHAKKADEWAQANASHVERQDRYTLSYRWQDIAVENHHKMQRLTNFFLNRRLQTVIDREIRCCDSTYLHLDSTRIETLPPTLNLLIAMVRIARYVLNNGLKMKQLIDLGMMLRTIGANVDFVKLQNWIDYLHMRRIVTFEASLLISLFDFSEDELPFYDRRLSSTVSSQTDDLLAFDNSYSGEWYFTQGKNIFVKSNNSKAMLWQMKHCMNYFRYYPSEMTTNIVHNFAHSMSNIEE